MFEEAILRREREGDLRIADWYRASLAEVYLTNDGREGKTTIPGHIEEFADSLEGNVTASSRIRALATHSLENPHYDPEGVQVGRAQMILGLLYKAKKKPALAVQHLTEAKRITSKFGATPMLARIDTALAELG